MSTNNTIAEFPRSVNQSKTITLDEVAKTVSDWRANKETRSQQIPDDIWKQIILLTDKFTDTIICGALGIPKMQLRRKLDEHKSPATTFSQPSQLSKIDFCEVKHSAAAAPPLYTPNKIPATNTLVVEFCRADGRIMKIHTTTDSFADLMKSFFVGS